MINKNINNIKQCFLILLCHTIGHLIHSLTVYSFWILILTFVFQQFSEVWKWTFCIYWPLFAHCLSAYQVSMLNYSYNVTTFSFPVNMLKHICNNEKGYSKTNQKHATVMHCKISPQDSPRAGHGMKHRKNEIIQIQVTYACTSAFS